MIKHLFAYRFPISVALYAMFTLTLAMLIGGPVLWFISGVGMATAAFATATTHRMHERVRDLKTIHAQVNELRDEVSF